jgi:archaellum component FlaC
MDEVAVARLYKGLDEISSRLTTIDSQLNDVVRLQEQIKAQQNTLDSHAHRLNGHSERLRITETWIAGQSNFGDTNTKIAHVAGEIQTIKADLIESKGQKDVVKEIFKWFSGILAAILAYVISNMGDT